MFCRYLGDLLLGRCLGELELGRYLGDLELCRCLGVLELGRYLGELELELGSRSTDSNEDLKAGSRLGGT